MTNLQLVVLALLDNATHFDWSVQGFGMLRLYIRDLGRLHVWDSKLRYSRVSMIHTHSWDLTSTVVFGKLRNQRFVESTDHSEPGGPYLKHRIITGYQSRLVTAPQPVWLQPEPVETYQPGDLYTQRASEIHLTDAEDGTVTLMKRREDVDGQADVYWPAGTAWGTAQPRAALPDEVEQTIRRALDRIAA